jgi:hypothetical protein
MSGSEVPRSYSEIRAERVGDDPVARVLDEVAALEREAADEADAVKRKRLLCAAEDLRCQLHETGRR